MAWFAKSRLLIKLTAGLAASGSAIALAVGASGTANNDNEVDSKVSNPKFNLGKVLASWTTNFEPSTPWDTNWDRRDPTSCVKPEKNNEKSEEYKEKLEKATPKVSRHIFLIRHGQYVMDAPKDDGRWLTKKGREQAACTGERLKELGHPYTSLLNSTMTRARDTANIIHTSLHDLPRTETDLLREGAPYPPEPPVGHYRPEPEFYKDGARIEAAFRKLFHRASPSQEKDSYEVVVCHANVIRYFVCRAMQFPPEAWLRMNLRHGSITYLTIRPSGRISLHALGDAGHIPADLLS